MFVSGVQQSDSVIHIYVSILFQTLFPLRLLQDIEQISLCYIVDPYCLCTIVCRGLTDSHDLLMIDFDPFYHFF